MTNLRAIIADDEQPLLAYLKKLLNEVWEELDICGEAVNGIEALALLNTETPDIAFLDIKMPGLSGIEAATQSSHKCHIIFVTAYDKYAIQAFEQGAIDYILKPITKERLLKTVDRIKQLPSPPSTDLPSLMGLLNKIEELPNYLQRVKVLNKEQTLLISIDDIIYFQSGDKYTSVISTEGEFLLRRPLKELLPKLDPQKFWQIHRSTIVNAEYIASFESDSQGRHIVHLKQGDKPLIASRSYSSVFKQI
mgnify:CR=1 FL=1